MTEVETSKQLTTENAEPLRAQLAITPDQEANCVVVGEGGESTTVTQRLKIPQSCLSVMKEAEDCHTKNCGECHTEVTDTEKQQSTYFKSEVHEKCICPVFEEHDCIPDIKGVREGAVITVVSIRDRAVLRELIGDMREVGATVSIEWLVKGTETTATVEIETGTITTKQRETIETALELGYYETPRKTSLDELANTLSVSKSAVSQRLNAAETKLVKSVFEN